MADPLALARTVLGRTEKEAAVKEYLKNGGVNLDPATQAWCASFVNSTLAQSGLPTAGVDAMSFKKYGDPVLTPRPGDIGVFARGDDPTHKGWEGHAGFSTGETDQYGDPMLISGNANDMVLEHPIDPNRLIGWRRPPGVEEPSLPDTMAASVSPDLRQAIDRTDLSRSLPTFDPRRMSNDGGSPIGRVGGAITPSIVGGFRKQRDTAERDRQAELAKLMASRVGT
jgi:uncharacterized protein (TIGR02594 family)